MILQMEHPDLALAGPSYLSVTAGFLYCAVAVLCWLAARGARHGGQPMRAIWHWRACFSLFILLALSRWLAVEEWLRQFLRLQFGAHSAYADRQIYQLPLAFAVMAATAWLIWWRGRPRQAGVAAPANRHILQAQRAIIGMGMLICLRVLSWHQTDLLLHGLRLNWVIDPALSIWVGWSAWQYRRALASGAARVNRPR